MADHAHTTTKSAPTRRSLLGIMTAFGTAGSGIGSATAAPPQPDGTLLALCAAFHQARAYQQQAGVRYDAHPGDSDELHAAWLEAVDQEDAAKDRVMAVSACTLAGLEAKAHVVDVTFTELYQEDESLTAGEAISNDLIRSLLRDVSGICRSQAPTLAGRA